MKKRINPACPPATRCDVALTARCQEGTRLWEKVQRAVFTVPDVVRSQHEVFGHKAVARKNEAVAVGDKAAVKAHDGGRLPKEVHHMRRQAALHLRV